VQCVGGDALTNTTTSHTNQWPQEHIPMFCNLNAFLPNFSHHESINNGVSWSDVASLPKASPCQKPPECIIISLQKAYVATHTCS
jgi:hypothetical protein